MKLYFFYEPNGRVEHTQMCLTEESAQSITALTGLPYAMREGEPGMGLCYVQNGAVITCPPQPSPVHVFDYGMRDWNDPRALDELRASAWDRIKRARAEAFAAGVEVPGLGRFDTNATANINVAAVFATLPYQPPNWVIAWTRFDDTVATLDLVSFPRMAMAVLSHASGVHERGRTLRGAIEQAFDAAALDLIVW
jgi:hypothetical protein